MNLLINALSVTNQSGRHVLIGHLSELLRAAAPPHRLTVLTHRGNAGLGNELGALVDLVEAPAFTASWLPRAVWECAALPGLVRRVQAQAIFSPAGVITPTVRIPQVAFCQNPWCLVDDIERSPAERVKAAIQRRAYRHAVHKAALMIFNSRYMREAYCRNAGAAPAHELVVYQAISDDTHAAAARSGIPRVRDRIVSVSAMAPHKGAATLVEAVALLRAQSGWAGSLVLVGGWPDRGHELSVRRRVAQLGLSDCVRFAGHVPDSELHSLYASSGAFCLLSRCESFGIPAVEAQAFGTPVVSSDCCAIPEICGEGGIFVDPRNAGEAARALNRLMRDAELWNRLSQAARANAARFRWSLCSRPLLGLFDLLQPESPAR